MDPHGKGRRFKPKSTAFGDAPKLFDEAKGSKSLKNRMRSLQRLLARPGLPRTLRVDKKGTLRKLAEQVAAKKTTARERRFHIRYKEVKFMEAKKAGRRARRAGAAVTELEAAAARGESEATAAALAAARGARADALDNVAYVEWFPRHLRYVALYAHRTPSEDSRLEERRAALRRWARANSEARAFLPQAPAADAGVDFGEDSESEEEGGAGGGGVENGEGAPAAAAAPARPPSAKRKRSEDEGAGEGGAVTAQRKQRKEVAPAAALTLPARPVARKTGAAKRADELSKRVALGGLAACDEDGAMDLDAQADIVEDPFFASGLGAGVPRAGEIVFREEEVSEEQEAAWAEGGGMSKGGYTVRGPSGASARWEREHANAARYRGGGPSMGGAAKAGAGREEEEEEKKGAEGGAAPAGGKVQVEGPDLSHLVGRKLKRAQRAATFAASKRDADGGAIMPGADRFTESFFGTARDPGARLVSSDKLAVANQRDAAAFGRGGWSRGGAAAAGAGSSRPWQAAQAPPQGNRAPPGPRFTRGAAPSRPVGRGAPSEEAEAPSAPRIHVKF
jgi:hypothetical protein